MTSANALIGVDAADVVAEAMVGEANAAPKAVRRGVAMGAVDAAGEQTAQTPPPPMPTARARPVGRVRKVAAIGQNVLKLWASRAAMVPVRAATAVAVDRVGVEATARIAMRAPLRWVPTAWSTTP